MNDDKCYIATLTFKEHATQCTNVGPFPWDEGYGTERPQIFFIELGGEHDISLFATDLKDAIARFDVLATRLEAISVKDVRLKVYPQPAES